MKSMLEKSGNAEIQVTSDNGIAGITVGRESGTSNTANAEIRFGGGLGATYSSATSFDLLNYDTGNFNYHLSAANLVLFREIFIGIRVLNSRLMTLTNTGRLGIGETEPTTTLYVSGVSTVTGASFVGSTLSVGGGGIIEGSLSVGGNINLTGSGGVLNGNMNGTLTGTLLGNVYANSGVSTFSRIGINTDYALQNFEIDGTTASAAFFSLGVGTTLPESAVDFRTAGALNNRFMLPPSATSTEKASIVPENGGVIYNTTTNKLEVYSGGSWTTLEGYNSGGGEVNQERFLKCCC